MLLSIAERAGAAELEPGARGGLRVRLTGHLDGRAAYQAIKAAKDRGWESYRAIERFIANDERVPPPPDPRALRRPPAGRPEGRCCSVCDPDPELERALAAATRGTRSATRPAPPLGNASAARNGASANGVASNGAGANGAAAADDGAVLNGLATHAPAPPPDPVDEAQYEKLRAWRLGQAEGKPAFTVAANTVLEEILRRRPGSLEEMIEIRGIGPAFCEKHGESLLEALAAL